ncbi:F subunit of K+-transporting ATPase [compost metagenome]
MLCPTRRVLRAVLWIRHLVRPGCEQAQGNGGPLLMLGTLVLLVLAVAVGIYLTYVMVYPERF